MDRWGMDRGVVKLIAAFDRADACREASAVDAVCHRCWEDVDVALEAVRQSYTPVEPVKTKVKFV